MRGIYDAQVSSLKNSFQRIYSPDIYRKQEMVTFGTI